MAFDQIYFSSIDEVSTRYRMIIPEYQRGYSWGESQWMALWDDADAISNLSNDSREHYSGSIMISAGIIGADGLIGAELIDGQQRWTTIAIMLKALGHKAYPITYKENEALQTYYDVYAQGNQELIPRLAEFKSFYTRNIEEAAKFFCKKSVNLTDEKREKLIEILLFKFKIFTLAIQPSFDIHVAFETINNRGKPLSTLEKLKNRLIYLVANSENKNTGVVAIKAIHRCWQGVYRWLGQGQILLDDDDFLRAHALGWFRHEKRADWLSSQLFDDDGGFSTKADVKAEEIEKYVFSLEHAAQWWYRLHHPSLMPAPIQQGLIALQRVPSASSKPLLLWALMRLAQVCPPMLNNSIEDSRWSQNFKALVSEVERFSALVVLANDRQTNVGQSDINRLTYAVAHPNDDIFLWGLAQPESADLTIKFATQYVSSLVTNLTSSGDGYIYPNFEWTGYFEPERTRVVIADRFRKGRGFYNWQLAKILIYLWEESLRGDKGLPEKKSWEKMAWDDSVEHIYPQNADQDSKWVHNISFDGRTSDFMRNSVVNCIGNLLLVSRSRNSSLSNKPFQNSDTKSGKVSQYKGASYSEDQVAILCKEWTVIQIAARGIAMWRLAQRRWNFEIISDEKKYTEWFPYLFGDHGQRILDGAASDKNKITHIKLKKWVDKFESHI